MLYHRVSTFDQDPTLARQALLDYAGRHRFDVLESFEETASAADPRRPLLAAAMQLAITRRAAIIVWKLDRFGRSVVEILGNIETLQRAGCQFHTTSQPIALVGHADAITRHMLTMLAASAELERELTRERTLLGLAAARARGVQLGRPRDADGPSGAVVAALRQQTPPLSWRLIAERLQCSPSAARRAHGRLTPPRRPRSTSNARNFR